MLQASQYNILKALASYAMEQSLVEVGGPALLGAVSNKIFEKYRCHHTDCYEHPEYLNAVLDSMSGTIHNVIVILIRNRLEEFSYHGEILEFVEKLNYGLNIDPNNAIAQ